jgi:hypothetical protein
LQKTGLADAVLWATTPDGEAWVARFGRVVDKWPGDQRGIFYAPLVNTVRGQIPQNVTQIFAKATALATSADRQRVTLSAPAQGAASLRGEAAAKRSRGDPRRDVAPMPGSR